MIRETKDSRQRAKQVQTAQRAGWVAIALALVAAAVAGVCSGWPDYCELAKDAGSVAERAIESRPDAGGSPE